MEAAYEIRMMGAGPSYQERQRGQVQCTECREEMALGLLAGHMQTQNGKEEGGRRCWEATPPGMEPHTYRMALLTAGVLQNCPV